jgi:predicted choloylglycine hydrolase
MKKKIIGVFIFLMLILAVFPTISSLGNLKSSDSLFNHFELIDGGWLEEYNGVKILYVNGSNYEMGYQHGYLLKEEAKQNLRAFLNYTNEVTYEELLEIWNIMKHYMPPEYIEEIQGLADGGGIPFEDVVAGYMTIVWSDMGCFGISAWGPATKDGRLYHTRSFDQPFDIQDPISGKYAHENSILVVRNPDNGYASLCPSVAGSMHDGGGINEQGIAIGQQVCWSKDRTFHGIPGMFRTQMVLDYASTTQEAINFLITNKTLGWNFVVSDAKIPIGYAVEVSGNHSYVGVFDDPTESIKPFWRIDNVIRRTNFFIDPTIAATQRDKYDPSGLLNLIKLIFRTDIFFAVWKSYDAMSETIENHWGLMDLNSTMCMFKKGYSGGSNLLLWLIVKLAEGTSFNRAWNIWVADPENGDMLVSFATREEIAFLTETKYFNLYDLLSYN